MAVIRIDRNGACFLASGKDLKDQLVDDFFHQNNREIDGSNNPRVSCLEDQLTPACMLCTVVAIIPD